MGAVWLREEYSRVFARSGRGEAEKKVKFIVHNKFTEDEALVKTPVSFFRASFHFQVPCERAK